MQLVELNNDAKNLRATTKMWKNGSKELFETVQSPFLNNV
jgi:hypothetical protein